MDDINTTPHRHLALMMFLVMGLSGCCNGLSGGGGGNSGSCVPDDHQQPDAANRPPRIVEIQAPDAVLELSIVTMAVKAEDPDGDTLRFNWKQMSGPPVTALEGSDSAELRFQVPKIVGADSLEFLLTVSDGKDGSNVPHTITLEATEKSGLIFFTSATDASGSTLYRYHPSDDDPVMLGPESALHVHDHNHNVKISSDRQYVVYKEGHYDDGPGQRLHVTRMDGTEHRSFADVAQFSIAPDSRYIAYEQAGRLHVTNLDGSEQVHVTVDDVELDYPEAGALAWSTDSQALAFLKVSPAGKRSLHVLLLSEPETPVVRRLSPESRDLDNDGEEDTNVLAFKWSPTASQIAFLGEFTRTGVRELLVVPALSASPLDDTINITGDLNVPEDCACHSLHPYNDVNFQWSPDGRSIAFVTEAAGSGIHDLFLVPVAGAGAYARVNVSGPVADRDGDGFADSSISHVSWTSSFAWSPQSDALAFVSDRDTVGIDEIFVAKLDEDGGVTGIDKVSGEIIASDGNLSNGAVDGDASPALLDWSPTGSQLAFTGDLVADGVSELFVVEWPEGVAGERLLVSGPITASDGNPDNGNIDGDVIYSKWSPRGDRIAFAGDLDNDRILELYLSHTSDGTRQKISGPINPPGAPGNPVFDIGIHHEDDLAWSPDGLQIAFRADYIEQFKNSVFLVNADSLDPAADRVLVSDNAYGAQWFGPPIAN